VCYKREHTDNVGAKLQIVSIGGELFNWGEHDTSRVEQNVEFSLFAIRGIRVNRLLLG
jgi:hypothetical protein